MDALSKQIQPLKTKIQKSFPVFPQPDKDKFIRHCPHPRDQEKAEEIRDSLAGKSWRDVNKLFLDQYFFYMTAYLTRSAFAYYLPAFLIECLNNFSKENKFIFTVINSGLSPGYTSLYYEDKDGFIDELIPCLTDEQYDAVCEFLELAFGLLDEWQQSSVAAAVRWGWNKKDNAVRRKALAYYDQFYNYTYPRHKEAHVQKLVEQIQQAFSATPMPSEKNLITSKQSDEEGEYALIFRGLEWNKIHPELIESNATAFGFFTREAFRYYLPAFLLADLYEYYGNSDPIFHLTHGLYKEESNPRDQHLSKINWEEYAKKKHELFNDEERKAIIAYLNYAAQKDQFSSDHINQALENYWLKTI